MKPKKIPIRFNLPGGLIVRKNRRRMAWTSLITMIVIVILSMFFVSESRIGPVSDIIQTLFYCLSAIVLAYNGVAVLDDKNLLNQKQDPSEEDDESTEEEKAIKSGKDK